MSLVLTRKSQSDDSESTLVLTPEYRQKLAQECVDLVIKEFWPHDPESYSDAEKESARRARETLLDDYLGYNDSLLYILYLNDGHFPVYWEAAGGLSTRQATRKTNKE